MAKLYIINVITSNNAKLYLLFYSIYTLISYLI